MLPATGQVAAGFVGKAVWMALSSLATRVTRGMTMGRLAAGFLAAGFLAAGVGMVTLPAAWPSGPDPGPAPVAATWPAALVGTPTPRPTIGAGPKPVAGARSALGAPVRIVTLGDSVAAASACSCPGFAHVLAHPRGSDAGPAGLTNAARDGLTSQGLLAQLDEPAVSSALRGATLVTITIGANDFDADRASDPTCGGGAGTDCYVPALQRLSDTLHDLTARVTQLAGPQATIAITGYWNVFLDGQVGARQGPTYVATSDALTRQVNQRLSAAAADSGAVYVDLYTPFKADGSRDDTDLLADDGDHPDESGHQVIASAIARAAPLAIPV